MSSRSWPGSSARRASHRIRCKLSEMGRARFRSIMTNSNDACARGRLEPTCGRIIPPRPRSGSKQSRGGDSGQSGFEGSHPAANDRAIREQTLVRHDERWPSSVKPRSSRMGGRAQSAMFHRAIRRKAARSAKLAKSWAQQECNNASSLQFFLVITALLWSLGGVLIKSIDWPPMAIAAGRSIAAIPVLLVCAGRQRFTFSPAQIGGAIAYAATVALCSFLPPG